MIFMNPVILSALITLPLLWYILRISPPAPKRVFFPAMQFLRNLETKEQSPSQTPWWILLIRMLIAALLIFALAKPVINPAQDLPSRADIRLIIDNDWAAAQSWDSQVKAAKEIITKAGRDGRQIYLLPTTPSLGETKLRQFGPLSQADAHGILRGLTPNPWNADYKAVGAFLKDNNNKISAFSFWLGHGLGDGFGRDIFTGAQNHGGVKYISPLPTQTPLLLKPAPANTQGHIQILVDGAPEHVNGLPITVKALGKDGDILDIQSANIKEADLPHDVHFDILESLKGNLNRFQISGRSGAGALFLLDNQFNRRSVGIASAVKDEKTAPLIEAGYYLKRALEPFADITIDTPAKLLDANMSVIILPDIVGMPTETLNKLQEWVKNGGLLLRFSGPNMANAAARDAFLLPVDLRAGERSLSGSLSWDEPQKIASFDENSPFFDLNVTDDVTIKQQVLADPAQNLEGKVWARLSDGTPLITAKSEDSGLLVLIHTTANTAWSDFALSGLYVSVLKRIINMAGTRITTPQNKTYTTLDPVMILDGFGTLTSPPASVQPINTKELDTLTPSSLTPPGIYGNGSQKIALNIGTNHLPLRAISGIPINVRQEHYGTLYEIDLTPLFLYGALVLFLLDWLIMILLFGAGALRIKRPAFIKPGLVLILLSLLPTNAHAAGNERDIKYASGLYLAYIQTGDSRLDSQSQRGLETLAQILAQRTSVEPDGVVGLNPDNDTLAFFPILYWPISSTQKQFSSTALLNIQNYLDQGGTILFDTRDNNQSTSSLVNTENAQALRAITTSLNIPPLAPIPNDHVLGRSFYLLDTYPGRYENGVLWLEQNSASGRDNVSSVLVGSNDWAGSWADSSGKHAMDRYLTTKDARQKEMALRFGINLMMYALTGNYKADQVHIPHILERLGR